MATPSSSEPSTYETMSYVRNDASTADLADQGDCQEQILPARCVVRDDDRSEVSGQNDELGVGGERGDGAAGHKTLVPALVDALRALGAVDIAVVCGGVIPAQDHAMLRCAGVAAIYGPGAHIPAAAAEVIEVVKRHRLAA